MINLNESCNHHPDQEKNITGISKAPYFAPLPDITT